MRHGFHDVYFFFHLPKTTCLPSSYSVLVVQMKQGAICETRNLPSKSFLSMAQSTKVFYCLWNSVWKPHKAQGLTISHDTEEHGRVDHGRSEQWQGQVPLQIWYSVSVPILSMKSWAMVPWRYPHSDFGTCESERQKGHDRVSEREEGRVSATAEAKEKPNVVDKEREKEWGEEGHEPKQQQGSWFFSSASRRAQLSSHPLLQWSLSHDWDRVLIQMSHGGLSTHSPLVSVLWAAVSICIDCCLLKKNQKNRTPTPDVLNFCPPSL